MKKSLLFSLIVTLLMGFILFPQNQVYAADTPIKLKLAHITAGKPFESIFHAAAMAFKYVMEKRSGGRYQVEVYPAGTLGIEGDLLEAVKNNAIQLHVGSLGGVSRVYPPALLGMAPYVFKNEAIGMEVLQGPFGQKLLDDFTVKTNIKGLAIVDQGTFNAVTNNVRPIKSLADSKGIKFRGMDAMQVSLFTALGGSAVPIAWTELYAALQTGVVNGQTNPPALIVSAKLYEVQKYLTLIGAQFGNVWLVANNAWYQALSPADKLIVRDATQAAIYGARGVGIVLEEVSLTELRAQGMNIYAPSDKELQEFQDAVNPIVLKWLKSQMEPKWVDEFLSAISTTEKQLGYSK
jgi:tripartite ATP-independent transporter DctP family solute receptor